MSRFRLNGSVAPNVTVDAKDVIGTKSVLRDLGYYRRPSNGRFGGWVDADLFDAIRNFQKDNGLGVDGLMRPGGPTEAEVNRHLAAAGGALADSGDRVPVIVPPNVDPRMPVVKTPFPPTSAPYVDGNGNIILEGRHPKTGFPVRPPKKT